MLYLLALSRGVTQLRWYRVVRLYLNGVAAKELSKPFYTGCVWSNFRLPRFLCSGGKNNRANGIPRTVNLPPSFFLFFPSLRKAWERRRALTPFNRDFYGWKASLVDRNLCRMNVNFTNRDSYSARIGCYVLPRWSVLPRDFLKKIICMRQKYVAKHNFGWRIKDRRKKTPLLLRNWINNRIAEKKRTISSNWFDPYFLEF